MCSSSKVSVRVCKSEKANECQLNACKSGKLRPAQGVNLGVMEVR